MENIKQHTFTLAQYTYTALSALRYPDGAPVVRIYSDSEFSSPEEQGPIINFNVLDHSGNIIGYSQVGLLITSSTRSQETLFSGTLLPSEALNCTAVRVLGG